MLFVAAFISGIIGWQEYQHTGDLGAFVEAGAILLIVVLNAILGLVQESKAEEALASLKKMAAPEAHVYVKGAEWLSPRVNWCPATSSTSKPETTSPQTCACSNRLTCGWKKPLSPEQSHPRFKKMLLCAWQEQDSQSGEPVKTIRVSMGDTNEFQ